MRGCASSTSGVKGTSGAASLEGEEHDDATTTKIEAESALAAKPGLSMIISSRSF